MEIKIDKSRYDETVEELRILLEGYVKQNSDFEYKIELNREEGIVKLDLGRY